MLISNFMKKSGRSLPVFLLVDVSGSMRGEKIDTVNTALKEMINTFKKIENPKGEIELCILTFGGDKVNVVKPLSKIDDNDVFTLSANGKTPLGAALTKVANMIDDNEIVSSRSYTPTIVLISDGNPTDFNAENKSLDEIMEWQQMKDFHSTSRVSKSVKLAMGIGHDVNINILKAFINNNDIPVISAKNNNTITKFFEWVTMTVSVRSLKDDPNTPTVEEPSDFDDDEMEF